MYKTFFFLVFLPLVVSVADAQKDWILKTKKEGISIYSRPVENSKINSILVKGEFEATLSQFVAVILDIGHSDRWQYHTKNFSVLKRVSGAELYYYAEVIFPWPAANRDFVSHLRVSQPVAGKTVTVIAENMPQMVPVKPGIIRLMSSSGKWTAVSLEKTGWLLNISYRLIPEGHFRHG